ncbi:ACRO protein, partial [Peucedramus taeniatus]|nr:ACRO protein [Peucedramus taeniatus]
DVSIYEVVMGTTQVAQPGPEAAVRRIKRLLVHQSYVAATAMNNIALLELDQPVECSDYIQLGCVPDSSLAVPELKTCYIAGWRNSPDSGAAVPFPIHGSSPMSQGCHSPSMCPCPPVPQAHPVFPITPRCGCDPGTASDSSLLAQGDIGGPLICKDHVGDYFWLVGLASWGKGCTGEKRPGVFTSTQHFRGWIQVQMGMV